MERIEHRQVRSVVVQGEQIAIRLARQPRGRLWASRRAARAERPALCDTERHRRIARRVDRDAVAYTRGQRRLEAQDGDQPPGGPNGSSIRTLGGRGFERIERGDECVVCRREGRGGRHLKHDLGECDCAREATDVRGQVAPQVHEIEGRQRVQLAGLPEVELGHALAQELEPSPEATLGSQGTLGDRALHAELARGEPHDLRRLAVAVRLKHDGGGSDERHSYGVAATAAVAGQTPTVTVRISL